MKIEIKILDTDYLHYGTSDETCSRCRRKLNDDEIPLRFWPEADTNYMLIYCDDCIDEVVQPIEENK